jgi:hypothetical protein
LTATRVIVTGRNATVSNQGGYWIIDNTSGTTIANNVSGSFNSGATSHTFPSKILDNRVLVGYQDNGSSNNGVSYVLDLSTETLKSIAGIAKEAGVESNVIDVVTQGECDFLSGLTPGSYYYSSATGFLSASVGDYEVGVAKSTTNLQMDAEAPIDGRQYARKNAGWELISVSGVDLTYTVASGKTVTAGRVVELVSGGVRNVEFTNGVPGGVVLGVAKTSQTAGQSVAVAIGPVITTTGLSVGSEYYILNGGTVSTSTNTGVKVGFGKSSTELVFRFEITDAQRYKSMLSTNTRTPSLESALEYDFWKTREVKTSSGTFTVPAGVTMIGIFCLGKGADSSSGNAGAGGGLSMKTKSVQPGDTISYTISAGIATCDGMTANPASGQTGGSASGGAYNFTGGSVTGQCGGGGCGGNNITSANFLGGGSLGHWDQPSRPSMGFACNGGMGMMLTTDVGRQAAGGITVLSGYGFGAAPAQNVAGGLGGGIGRPPKQLGIIVSSDISGANTIYAMSSNRNDPSLVAGDWNGGTGDLGSSGSGPYYPIKGGLGGGGGSMSSEFGGGAGGGFGGGGGGNSAGSYNGGAGGFGGGGGRGANNGGAGGFGGVGGRGANNGGSGGFCGGGGGRGTSVGGSAVVVFVY